MTYANGALACYCDLEEVRSGWWTTTFGYSAFKLKFGDDSSASLKLDRQGAMPICRTYMLSELMAANYGIVSSFAIFLGNIFFVKVAQPLVELIGLHYKTNESVLISITIFGCLFLNSCMLPLLLQANFSADYPGSFMDNTFSFGGRNSDFSSNWYKDIGPMLTLNLVFLAILPIVLVIGEYFSLKISRWMKRRVYYKGHENNMTDNIKFLELNAGPEYNFMTKTASLNCVLFITLVFGVTFPFFYIIALGAIVIQYMVERYTLACFYRLPPKFSLSTTQTNISILTYAALTSGLVAFWLYGN